MSRIVGATADRGPEERRDRELRAREDRHRFTVEKRALYAELLTSALHLQRHVNDMFVKIHRYIDEFTAKTDKKLRLTTVDGSSLIRDLIS
jgi:hypothetical protein